MRRRETIVGCIVLALAGVLVAWRSLPRRTVAPGPSTAAHSTDAGRVPQAASSAATPTAKAASSEASPFVDQATPSTVSGASEGPSNAFIARQQALREKESLPYESTATVVQPTPAGDGWPPNSASAPEKNSLPADPFSQEASADAADAWTPALRNGAEPPRESATAGMPANTSPTEPASTASSQPASSQARRSQQTEASTVSQETALAAPSTRYSAIESGKNSPALGENKPSPAKGAAQQAGRERPARIAASALRLEPENRLVFPLHADEEEGEAASNEGSPDEQRETNLNYASEDQKSQPLGDTLRPAGAANSADAYSARGPMKVHLVERGDTLFGIAERILGDGKRWRELYELNKDFLGDNPHYLEPGFELLTPDESAPLH